MKPFVENIPHPNSSILVTITVEHSSQMTVVLRHDCNRFLCQVDVEFGFEPDPIWSLGYGAGGGAATTRRVHRIEVVHPCPSCSRRRRRVFAAGRVRGTRMLSERWTHACRGPQRAATLGFFDVDKGHLDVRCRKCERLLGSKRVPVTVPIDGSVEFALSLVDHRVAEWIDNRAFVSPRD